MSKNLKYCISCGTKTLRVGEKRIISISDITKKLIRAFVITLTVSVFTIIYYALLFPFALILLLLAMIVAWAFENKELGLGFKSMLIFWWDGGWKDEADRFFIFVILVFSNILSWYIFGTIWGVLN